MNKHLCVRIMLILGLLIPAIAIAQPSNQDSLTIQDAIALTLKNNPLIQQAVAQENAATAGIGASQSYYYPDVSISGIYTRVGPVTKISLPGETIALFPADNYDIHLAINQMLYDFGRVSTGVKAAKAGVMSSADRIEQVKSGLAYQAIAIFNNILILNQSIAVLDEQIEALNQHLEASRKKVEAGTATNFDVLTTEVRIALTRDQKIDTQKSLETQKVILRQLTGLPENEAINAKGEFFIDSLTLNLDSLLILAQDQRPEMLLAGDAETSALIQMHLATLGNKPSLFFNFTSGIKDGYYPNLYKRTANFTAGLMLQVPIFEGRRTHYQSEQARAGLKAANDYTQNVRRQVISEVQQALTGVRLSYDKIRNAQIQLKHAEDALSMAEVQYEAGVITNLDLLDTQTSLSQAKLSLLSAYYTYTSSLYSLNQATGNKNW